MARYSGKTPPRNTQDKKEKVKKEMLGPVKPADHPAAGTRHPVPGAGKYQQNVARKYGECDHG
ncbi:hypothetical protein GCM10023149_28890 [Mucilaginibacter gynuensis]|uniref:Uncharacterized protein n=1 Tax=Mucilaginibacter gynuensis TaxID=1302236 RepID=A0ABP8GKU5_9SPHI